MKPTSLLNGYDIQRVIGSGACGLVYLALEVKSQQLCALKEFPATTKAVQNFFRELSALFSLHHPNIIRCLNLIHGQGTSNYLVFEYAEGGTLRDRLIEGEPLAELDALRILRQITLGLEQAHRHELIHCDLKPENILVCLKEEVATYKIGDLGVAVCLGREESARRAVGSPAYMAPEQFYDSCTVQSDLYSLGVMLYEMVCGMRPFDGPPASLFTSHCREQADFSRIQHEGVRQLVSDLMSKQPFLRPATATDLLRRVEALLPETKPDLFINSNLPPVPALSDLLSRRCSAVPLNHRLMPGSRAIFAPEPSRSCTLWLSDDKSTDLYDLTSQRLHPQFLAEPVLTCSAASDLGDDAIFATPFYVYRLQAGDSRPVRLFEPLVQVKALQVDRSRKRIYYADNRRVYGTTLTGHQLWRIPCENYYLDPQLLVLSDGGVAVSSGPSHPLIRLIDVNGKLVGSLQVPGPVLQLWGDAEPGRFHAVILGLGAEEPSRLITVSNGRIVRDVELGEGVYAVRQHGELLSLHAAGHPTVLTSLRNEPVVEIPHRGTVLGACWLPATSHYALLLRDGYQTELSILQLRPETSATEINRLVS